MNKFKLLTGLGEYVDVDLTGSTRHRPTTEKENGKWIYQDNDLDVETHVYVLHLTTAKQWVLELSEKDCQSQSVYRLLTQDQAQTWLTLNHFLRLGNRNH